MDPFFYFCSATAEIHPKDRAMTEGFFQTKNLYALVGVEPFVVVSCLLGAAWLFYQFFLREVSEERHTNLRRQYGGLFRHYLVLFSLFALYLFMSEATEARWAGMGRYLPYVALLTLFWGIMVAVKSARMLLLQYLFLGSMKAGVPVLIVNIFSLLASLALFLWATTEVFGLRLAPLLATSAAFSIILGLALQDTLGNLFAGISLQVDHSFEIGDWIEVVTGIQRVTGQVKEITWRSTTLIGWYDEVIVLPNRFMANAQISNFRGGAQPIVRSQVFRLPHSTDIGIAKDALNSATRKVPRIRQVPPPLVYVAEIAESHLSVKVAYYIDNFGAQFTIGDELFHQGLVSLAEVGIEPATPVLEITQ